MTLTRVSISFMYTKIDSIFFVGWFGMRKDFCSFILFLCPCLREYANISYNFTLNNFTPNGQQNERTNLTAVHVSGHDYDSSDGKKMTNKLKKVVTQQPNSIIYANPRLDTPD